MTRNRVAAAVALAAAPATLILAMVLAAQSLPRLLGLAGCAALAVIAGMYGILRRGFRRAVAWAVAVAALAGAGLLLLTGRVLAVALVAAGAAVSLAAARVAFTTRVRRPAAPPPRRPVLFLNPRSGGGKAERFSLVAEARRRGVEPVELRAGDDLRTLVRDAVAGGADALAMAGGDGSQAIVAALAAQAGLPYACVPAGTRNHFALDLGVDRDDVVGSLDAFVDGSEQLVDLAEVNGQVFVNNVSLGLYAEAVQRAGYRDAKFRSLLATAPDVLDSGRALDLRWAGPDGRERAIGAAVLVSNNHYRLGNAVGSGTRPRLDTGVLGIVVVDNPALRRSREQPGAGAEGSTRRPWLEWSATTFEVHSSSSVPAGIDGEAVVLQPPLRFRIRPSALRVRVARRHPGASPSAAMPDGLVDAFRALTRIAFGQAPTERHVTRVEVTRWRT